MLFKIPYRIYLYPVALLIFMHNEPAIYWWLGFMVLYVIGIFYNFKKGAYTDEE